MRNTIPDEVIHLPNRFVEYGILYQEVNAENTATDRSHVVKGIKSLVMPNSALVEQHNNGRALHDQIWYWM